MSGWKRGRAWGLAGPSSELGRVSLGPPGSTGLVRLEEEEAGLLRFSEAQGTLSSGWEFQTI